MAIHILFTDGSNPFIRYDLTPEEFALELLKWTENYILDFNGISGGSILHFTATDKLTAARPADLPPW